MRAITIRQPYAHAIIHLGKDVENRTRNIAGSYRGQIAIHASKAVDLDDLTDGMQMLDRLGVERPRGRVADLGFGVILGVVDLVDVHGSAVCYSAYTDHYCSPWAMPDSTHLVLANPVALPEPIPAKGRLGLWTPDPDLTARIEKALR